MVSAEASGLQGLGFSLPELQRLIKYQSQRKYASGRKPVTRKFAASVVSYMAVLIMNSAILELSLFLNLKLVEFLNLASKRVF